MVNVAVIGGTGLCGSAFVKLLSSAPSVEKVTAFTRSPLPENLQSPKIENIVKDSKEWTSSIESLENTDIFVSGFGTTRHVDPTYEIDTGVNIESAKAARKAGVNTFVLVSSFGASAGSRFPYMKMKGQIEDEIIGLKFPRTVILRPGLLLGDREKPKSGKFLLTLGKSLRGTFLDRFVRGTYGDEVAKAGLYEAFKPLTPGAEPEVIIVETPVATAQKYE